MAEHDFAHGIPRQQDFSLGQDLSDAASPTERQKAIAALTSDNGATPHRPKPTRSNTAGVSSSGPSNEETDDDESGLDADYITMPTPRRVHTEPMESETKPAALRRTTTLLGTLVRKGTNGGMGNEPQLPYPDDAADMSDSSDSENEGTKMAKKDSPLAPKSSDKGELTQGGKKHKRGRSYSRFAIHNDHFRTKGRVSNTDGRLKISISHTANQGYIAKALGQSIKHHLNIPHKRNHGGTRWCSQGDQKVVADDAQSIAASIEEPQEIPRLNIVIMVIGSRGDIQPFVKLAKILKEKHGHRVRVATHPTFREFVEKDYGLEFFSVGGDPSELMSFMVKNPGLIPNIQTIREGEIQRRRTAMGIMFEGFWNATISGNELDAKGNPLPNPKGKQHDFVADAIIANPPSMAHVHIAEKLGIPLHIMFTFPYSPTQQFPHPLANVKPQKSNTDVNYLNFMSYPLVEMMTWQGLGDIVNHFRERTLGLEPVSSLWAPGALYRMRVPYTYLWSPSLVPKPQDWGEEITIAGFTFLAMSDSYKPDKDLEDFLNAGEPPIYIGFGSIVVDDPNAFTDLIFEATKKAGVRALVNKGWGGFGKSNDDTPDHIFMLGNTPHDWLFPRVKAVVHHGGAGTTAAGLKFGKPTMIVPFFGDQPFWGAMVADAKAGAHECIPYKRLTVEQMTEGIKQCLTEEAQINVQKIADSIEAEGDGADNAVKAFHSSLTLSGRHSMRCSILNDRVAVWKLRNSSLRLSPVAAEILHEEGRIKWKDLKLLRHYEWNDFDGPGEPITGGIGAVKGSLYDMGEGVGMVPVRIAEHLRKHEESQRRKAERKVRREERKKAKALAAEGAQNGDPQLERQNTNNTVSSALSAPEEPLARLLVGDVGSGFKRSGTALLTMPNNLHVAIARGFHNAPRLWGDATVRKPIRVTGMATGLEAARKEFVYGIWDGWTGVVMQPVGGWQDGDNVAQKFAGVGSGIGKGFGGFLLKNLSAIIAPPAYIAKGAIVAVRKRTDGSPGTKRTIRKTQILRSHKDLSALRGGENDALTKTIEEVDAGWQVYQDIWDEAEKKYGRMAASYIARYKFHREIKRWEEVGALDNVNAVDKALKDVRNGRDVDELYAERKAKYDAKRAKEEKQKREKKRAERAKRESVAREKKARDASAAGKKGASRSRTSSQPSDDTASSTKPDEQGGGRGDTAASSEVEAKTNQLTNGVESTNINTEVTSS